MDVEAVMQRRTPLVKRKSNVSVPSLLTGSVPEAEKLEYKETCDLTAELTNATSSWSYRLSRNQDNIDTNIKKINHIRTLKELLNPAIT